MVGSFAEECVWQSLGKISIFSSKTLCTFLSHFSFFNNIVATQCFHHAPLFLIFKEIKFDIHEMDN
jgi:hypothetical protein